MTFGRASQVSLRRGGLTTDHTPRVDEPNALVPLLAIALGVGLRTPAPALKAPSPRLPLAAAYVLVPVLLISGARTRANTRPRVPRLAGEHPAPRGVRATLAKAPSPTHVGPRRRIPTSKAVRGRTQTPSRRLIPRRLGRRAPP